METYKPAQILAWTSWCQVTILSVGAFSSFYSHYGTPRDLENLFPNTSHMPRTGQRIKRSLPQGACNPQKQQKEGCRKATAEHFWYL